MITLCKKYVSHQNLIYLSTSLPLALAYKFHHCYSITVLFLCLRKICWHFSATFHHYWFSSLTIMEAAVEMNLNEKGKWVNVNRLPFFLPFHFIFNLENFLKVKEYWWKLNMLRCLESFDAFQTALPICISINWLYIFLIKEENFMLHCTTHVLLYSSPYQDEWQENYFVYSFDRNLMFL